MKKSILFASLGSVLAISGCAVGGWALVQNSKNIEELLNESIGIVPILKNSELIKYSTSFILEHKSLGDIDESFDFTKVRGYNDKLDYKIVRINEDEKDRKMILTIKISSKERSYLSREYTKDLEYIFASEEESANQVILQTALDIQTYKENITLLNSPDSSGYIDPANIIISSNRFTKKGNNNFVYQPNGAEIEIKNIYNSASDENALLSFKENLDIYIGEENYNLDQIMRNVYNGETMILFSINESDSIKKGVLVNKDFSTLNESNLVENAHSIPLKVISTSLPTAIDIINSFNNGQVSKFLKFDIDNNQDYKNNFNKFDYEITSIELSDPENFRQDSVDVTITIYDKDNRSNKKTYITSVKNLLNAQQAILDNFLLSDDPEILIKPIINSLASTVSIENVVANIERYVQFRDVDLQKFVDWEFEIETAVINVRDEGEYINFDIRLTNKLAREVTYLYSAWIYSGWRV